MTSERLEKVKDLFLLISGYVTLFVVVLFLMGMAGIVFSPDPEINIIKCGGYDD